MELEVKHLASYLPYGFKIKDSYNGQIHCIEKGDAMDWVMLSYKTEKPHKIILRPMSDLYKQIKNGIEDEVTYIEDLSKSCQNEIEFGFIKAVLESGKLLEMPLPYWVFQWFCKNHFDFQSLINNELAIDINTLSVEWTIT